MRRPELPISSCIATLLRPHLMTLKLGSSGAQAAPFLANHNGVRWIVGTILDAGRPHQATGLGWKQMLEVGGVLRGGVSDTSHLVCIEEHAIPHVDDGSVAHAAGAIDCEPSPSLTLGGGLAGVEEYPG